MTRYYFDIRDDVGLWPDSEGLELAGLQAAEIEAAHSLAELARNVIGGRHQHQMAIEVRTADRPLFKATFIFDVKRHQ